MAAGVAALPTLSHLAKAQTYPTKRVRIIISQAAGSASDIFARLLGHRLSERLGQQFVIEPRPGAAGNIALEAVIRAPADGYTLLLVGNQHAINTTLFDKLNFNLIRDIAPVAGIVRVPLVMEVNPSVLAKTVPEFITYTKANPGKLNFASPGNGTSQHVSGELFKAMSGVSMLHVPYRGTTPALTDLRRGWTSCQTFQLWENSCRATRRAHGSVSGCRRIPPLRLSISSIVK
jgi:tripartite-type tricarboxylate transporter receptor subunit TctC